MSDPNAATDPKPRPRGIYLLPNIMTTAALFSGFYAIIAAINDHHIAACVAVFVAGLFDGLDGRVARMTNTASEFGVQYDSLSDLISFGVAPSIIMYTWSLESLKDYGNFWGKVGWLCAFLYVVCAALRLARFNTQAGVADKRYFQGLASPAAAGTMVAFVWCFEDLKRDLGITGANFVWFAVPLTVLIALLMFSSFRYFSFKTLPRSDGGKVPFKWIAIPVLALVLIALAPPQALLTIGLVYVASGPILTLWQRRRLLNRRVSNKSDSP
jgi:CDP-diacylglycerol---serine O-phosphatidyltransferase